MPTPIDRAYVQILPDLREFNSKLKSDVSATLSSVTGDLDKVNERVRANANEISRSEQGIFTRMRESVSSSVTRVRETITRSGTESARAAAHAGSEAGRGFTRGIDGQLRDVNSHFVREGEQAGSSFSRGLQRNVRAGGEESQGIFRKMGEQLKRSAEYAAPYVGVFALGETFRSSIELAREEQKTLAQTAAVIRSTGGAAHVSARQAEEFALRLSDQVGVSHTVIQANENLLLTFTGIQNRVGKGNDIFNQATTAVLDMSTALKEDGKSASIQLGKALQDPVRGATALRRVGVALSKQQQDQIKVMVAHNNTLGAQKLILHELTREFGGSAAAQVTSGDKMRVTWENFRLELGQRLLPIIDKVESFISDKLLPGVTSMFNGMSHGKGVVTEVGTVLGSLIGVGRRLITDVLDGMRGAWQAIGPLVLSLGRFIKDTLIPAFLSLISTVGHALGEAFRSAGHWMAQHKTLVQSIVVILGTFYGVIKLVRLGMLAWSAATRLVAAAQVILNAVMDANPIVLITAAIIALAAGFIYAYKHSATFRQIIADVWGFLKRMFNDVWSFLKRWGPLILAVLAPVFGVPLLIWQHWNQILGFLKRVWNAVWPFIKTWGPVALAVLAPFIGIPLLIFAHFSQIKGFLTRAWNAAYAAVRDGVNAVVHFIATLPGKIANIFNGSVQWLERTGRGIIHGLWTGLRWFWDNVLWTWYVKIPTRIINFLLNAAGGAGNWLLGLGKRVIRGFWTGLRSVFSDVVNWFRDLPGHILSALGIHSPPRWAIHAGEWIIKAVLQGMKNLGALPLQWVRSLANDISGVFNTIVGTGGFDYGLSGVGKLPPGVAHVRAGGLDLHQPYFAQQYAKELLGKFGWAQSQFQSLWQLWNQESGWRWNATNPSSGAYGIAQALPPSKYGSVAGDWRTNAATQILWGLNYIKGRYGSPAGAWQHEVANNWYERGAWSIQGDQLAHLHNREMVLPARLASAVRDSLRNGRPAAAIATVDEAALARAILAALAGARFVIDADGLARIVTKQQGIHAAKGHRQ